MSIIMILIPIIMILSPKNCWRYILEKCPKKTKTLNCSKKLIYCESMKKFAHYFIIIFLI